MSDRALMTGPDLMRGERRNLYLLYARYMRMSIADATATLEEEHDEVVRAWDRHYAARDRAEAGEQA